MKLQATRFITEIFTEGAILTIHSKAAALCIRSMMAALILTTNDLPVASSHRKLSSKSRDKQRLSALATETEFGGNDGGGKKGTGVGDGGGGGGGGSGGDQGGGPGDFGPGFGGTGDGGKGPEPPLSLWQQYLALLESHPVLTKAITSSFLNFAGDLLCQTVIEKKKELDFRRMGVISLIGLVLVGPTLHFWYGLLNRTVKIPGGAGIVSRLVLDQFLFSPAFIAAFFSTLLTLEGRPSLIQATLQKEWVSTCIANWKIWIPFQFLNFWLVPPQLQVGAANVIALLWTVYLSFVTHK
ncbi:protein Mpv17 [Klebsormidium nitens]|uniref:Protein Mpv17 n=1 Tax=Klebsormidium nitens TaxID=105231 RepID=A0A1Y1IDS3_KLENI|nr:protein Mpv17 [Klebsormidium nitens]|eukprot:GAQ88733.1 protein Mpv17 [Klebsormidium nitens]